MPKEARPSTGEQAKQHALTQLRQAILHGDMAPAQRLVENELAEQFDVTRASIRAALIDLAAEGLVERIRNRGSRVRVVTVEEAVAITECRMVLEGTVRGQGGRRGRRRPADRTDGPGPGHDQGRGRRRAGHLLRAQPANCTPRSREFSGQQTAVALLERLNAQLVRHRFQLALRPGRPQQSLSEHLAMIEAITARDPQAAEAAVRAHLTSVIEALRD
jgi:DNA-binding GntR family transcriptional regulator